MTHDNDNGFTLLELVICVAIAGIVMMAMNATVKMQMSVLKKIRDESAQAATIYSQLQSIKQEFGVLNHCDFEQDCDGHPVACYAGGLLDRAIACDEARPCVFEGGKWKRQNGWAWSECQYGVIVKQIIVVE